MGGEGRGGVGRRGEGLGGERRGGEKGGKGRGWEERGGVGRMQKLAATAVSHATASQEVHYTIRTHKTQQGGHGEIPAADLFELPLPLPFILCVPPLLLRQNRRGLLDALQLAG